MNINDNNNYCSGCGACSLVCPTSAISVNLDENGFIAANVTDKCINCGICTKVCSKFGLDEVNNISDGDLFAVTAKNDSHAISCTSSGLATKIAEYGIAQGYSIVGVIYDYKDNIAKYVIANTIDDIEKMKGSKYLQAYTLPAFEEVLNSIKSNSTKKYIVFGMPCQINGLKSAVDLFNLENEIIYIDFFCHGVPSYLVWEKYLSETKTKNNLSSIDNIKFRNKCEGWHNFIISINGCENYAIKDNFYNAFFDNALLNDACYECSARKGSTKADLRLGDFWGKNYKMNNVGVSACVVMTDIGKELLNNCTNEFDIVAHNDKSDCFNHQSLGEYVNKGLHTSAMEDLKSNLSLTKVIKKYQKKMGVKYKLKRVIKRIVYSLPNNIREWLKGRI